MKTTTLRMPVETAALARALLQHTTAPNLGRLLNDVLIDPRPVAGRRQEGDAGAPARGPQGSPAQRRSG